MIAKYIELFTEYFKCNPNLEYYERMANSQKYSSYKLPVAARALSAYFAATELSTVTAPRGVRTPEERLGQSIAIAISKIEEVQMALSEHVKRRHRAEGIVLE